VNGVEYELSGLDQVVVNGPHIGAADVCAGHCDGYIHYGNVHENQPSSYSDDYLRRLLTTHSGAGRSHLGCPYMASERARSGRHGTEKH